ncbi:MAG: hypothetical protein ABL877_13505 [Thiobacillus sp.]
MSRWSADSLHIALTPGEVALQCGEQTRVLTSAERTLVSLLPLLDEALADASWHRPRVDVILSQHFVRQHLTLPPGKALSRVEETALVAASLHDIYGAEARSWRIAVHSQPPHAGLVGAAIEAESLKTLEALLTRHGARTLTITPLASRAVQALPARFNGWWVGVEPGWVTLMGAIGGVWQHLAAQPIGSDWHATLPEWIAREAECAAMPIERHVYLQPIGVGAVSSVATTGWRWDTLPHTAQARGAAALTHL